MFRKDPYKKRLYVVTTLINRMLGDYKASKIYKAIDLYNDIEDKNTYEINTQKEKYYKLIKLLEKIRDENLKKLIETFLILFDEYFKESQYHKDMGDIEKSSLIKPLYYARYIFKLYELQQSLHNKNKYDEKIEEYRKEIN